MSLVWDQTIGNMMIDTYDRYVLEKGAAALEVAQQFAPLIEAWLKQNAPWTDRTGNLRQSLWADGYQVAESLIEIAFDYGLSYGVFLEFGRAGLYAIIGPALDYWLPQIIQALKDIGLDVVVTYTAPEKP